MAQMVARDSQSQGDLISWWEGDDLDVETEVSCAMDEVVLFIEGDEVVSTLGPGRHSLAIPPGPLERFVIGTDELGIAFVTTTVIRLDGAGVLEELDNEGAEDVEPTVSFVAAVRVIDPARIVPLLEKLSDEESLEDWLIDELVLHAQTAASESNRSLDELTSGTYSAQLGEKTTQNANEVLGEYGIEVQRVDDCAISVEEE